VSQSKQMPPEPRLRGTLRELQAVPRGGLHALQLAGQMVPAADERSTA